jgi:DNA-binding HxlR family transcriptional regulator
MNGVNDGRGWADSGESDSETNLRDLVSHPHVVEVLDALSDGPMALADLVHRTHAGRRGIATALRTLGARGLVSKSRAGSWDTKAPAGTVYRLTVRGRAIVDVLSRFAVWASIVEGHDPDNPPRSSPLTRRGID